MFGWKKRKHPEWKFLLQAVEQPYEVAVSPNDLASAPLAGHFVIMMLEHEDTLLLRHEHHENVLFHAARRACDGPAPSQRITSACVMVAGRGSSEGTGDSVLLLVAEASGGVVASIEVPPCTRSGRRRDSERLAWARLRLGPSVDLDGWRRSERGWR